MFGTDFVCVFYMDPFYQGSAVLQRKLKVVSTSNKVGLWSILLFFCILPVSDVSSETVRFEKAEEGVDSRGQGLEQVEPPTPGNSKNIDSQRNSKAAALGFQQRLK